jgi:Sodium/hydrogen exchanger family
VRHAFGFSGPALPLRNLTALLKLAFYCCSPTALTRSVRVCNPALARVFLPHSCSVFVCLQSAEACGLSGIVGSLFCGIFMNHYNTRVLSANGKNLAYHGFKLLAYLSETSVFVQVGLNVIAFAGDFRIGLVILMIVVCIFARACQVFTYANVLNCFRSKPIPTNHIIQIWHAGLRGAIAYALSTSFPSQNQGLVSVRGGHCGSLVNCVGHEFRNCASVWHRSSTARPASSCSPFS